MYIYVYVYVYIYIYIYIYKIHKFAWFEPEFQMTGSTMHASVCTLVWGFNPLQTNRGQFVVALQDKSATPFAHPTF